MIARNRFARFLFKKGEKHEKIFVVVLAFVMVMSMNVFSLDSIQTQELEIEVFLKENNISASLINELKAVYDTAENSGKVVMGSFNDKVIEIKNLAETYNFSKEQVVDYIEGVISTPTVIIGAPEVPDVETTYAPKSNRVGDYGIGYEVKSDPGYVKQSAFLYLPEVEITNTVSSPLGGTSAYMFYSFETGGHAIDVGLWYHYGDGVWGWRDTYLRSFVQEPNADGEYVNESSKTANGLIGVYDGDYLFMEASIVNGTDGQRYIQCRITDGNNLNVVKSDFSVWVGGNIGSSAVINRQITLCNGNMNYNTGEKIEGADFRNAKIFTSSSGTGIVINSNHTNDSYCGRFGQFDDDYKQVKVNAHYEWDMENIDIYFDSAMRNVGE